MVADCDTTIELARIAVRGVALAMVSAGGILCVYFGFRLYQSAVLSRVTGELSGLNLKVKLSAASPGVFLAAFGAYLLFTVSQHRWIEQETEERAVQASASQATPRASVWQVQHSSPAAPAAPTCACPPRQKCLLYKTTRVTSGIGGTSEVDAAALNEHLAAIRAHLERITPVQQAERIRHVKATQALMQLEAIVAEAVEEP